MRTRALAAEAFAELSTTVPVHAGDQRPAPPPATRTAPRVAGGTVNRSRRAAASPATTVSVRPRLALTVLAGAAAVAALDAGILGMALPSLLTGLHTSAAGARLSVTIPMVAMAATLPVAAGAGDRIGAARLLRWALATLTAASALSAGAWTLPVLLPLRALQGMASGMLLPAALTLFLRLRPGRAWSAGLIGGGLLLAPAIVPALGAWLAAGVPWRVLPLVLVALGAAALAGARLWLPAGAGEPGRRVDVAGMATATLALGALVLALLQGAAWGWTSYAVLGLLSLSGLTLGLLLVVELSVPEPLLDLRHLRPLSAAAAPLLLAVVAAVLGAGFVEVPLLLQGAGHLGALQVTTGLALPPALAVAAMAASAAFGGRVDARWTVVAGMLAVALGTYLLHGLPPSAAGRIAALACLRAAGLGVVLGPLAGSAGAAARRVAAASALVALGVVLPTAAGVAVVSSALSVPAWWPGSHGAAGTVQERLVLRHGDAPLPLSGPAFLGTVLATAAIAAFGALIALCLPARREPDPR